MKWTDKKLRDMEYYNDYSTYIKKEFSQRVQKISVDAGFSCHNRDGSKARGGCVYCDNNTFNPFYCSPQKTITQQLDEGIAFFSKKYKSQRYLAYFQAYTNTYASPEILDKLYAEAVSHPDIIGLVIATRPDCVPDEVLDLIGKYAKKYYVVLEIGVESTLDRSLKEINRGHTFADAIDALNRIAAHEILCGIHLIMGLPGEERNEIIQHADIISGLPFKFLKLHQLQVIKNTILANQYQKNPEKFHLFSPDDYLELIIDFLERLSPQIIVERFLSESPREMLLAPKWGGLKNYQFANLLLNRMKERETQQGIKYPRQPSEPLA